METIDFRTKEEKKEAFKESVKQKYQDAKVKIEEHKGLIIVLAPVAIGFATKIIGVAGKRSNLNKEQKLKDLYCYDRSLGHYWLLKRKLTSGEWLEIDKRKMNGERLADILRDMRVLK